MSPWNLPIPWSMWTTKSPIFRSLKSDRKADFLKLCFFRCRPLSAHRIHRVPYTTSPRPEARIQLRHFECEYNTTTVLTGSPFRSLGARAASVDTGNAILGKPPSGGHGASRRKQKDNRRASSSLINSSARSFKRPCQRLTGRERIDTSFPPASGGNRKSG